jgi:hypothetical protein
MERVLAASQERHCSVYTAMRQTDVQAHFAPRTCESIRNFLRLVEEWRSPLQETKPVSLTAWAERWLAETGYVEDLRRGEKNP